MSLKTSHVGINVTELTRSIAFYEKVLGLTSGGERTHEGLRFAMLGRDGSLVVTLWQQSTGTFAADRPGLHHLAFEVPDREAVEAIAALVEDAGGAFVHDGVVRHGENSQSGGIFFTDPDGTRLEVSTADVGAAPVPVAGAPTCGFF